MKRFEEPKFETIVLASSDVIMTTSGAGFDIDSHGYTNNLTPNSDTIDNLLGI